MYMYKIFIIDKNDVICQPKVEELKELFRPLLEKNSEEIYPIVKNTDRPRLNSIFTEYGFMVSENKVDDVQKTVCGKNVRIVYFADLGNVTNQQAFNFITHINLCKFKMHPHTFASCKNIYKKADISVNKYMLLVLLIAKTNTEEFNLPERIFINITIGKGLIGSCMSDTIIYELKKDIKAVSELLHSNDISYSGFEKPVPNSMKGFEFLLTLNERKFRKSLKSK